VPIHPDSVERTIFVTTEGRYKFLAKPFGLKNASSVFQRAIVQALGDLVKSYAVVYINDVLIVERVVKVKVFFQCKKCQFLHSEIQDIAEEAEGTQPDHVPKDGAVPTD